MLSEALAVAFTSPAAETFEKAVVTPSTTTPSVAAETCWPCTVTASPPTDSVWSRMTNGCPEVIVILLDPNVMMASGAAGEG